MGTRAETLPSTSVSAGQPSIGISQTGPLSFLHRAVSRLRLRGWSLPPRLHLEAWVRLGATELLHPARQFSAQPTQSVTVGDQLTQNHLTSPRVGVCLQHTVHFGHRYDVRPRNNAFRF